MRQTALRLSVLLLASAALAACLPSGNAPARADWPALVPLQGLVPKAAPPGDPAAEVNARAASLRARAAAIRSAEP
jgi:hypothetical protein